VKERPPKPDPALLARAAAGRDAVRFAGADPVLTLALVVWPSDELAAALEHAGTVKGSGRGVTVQAPGGC
jgi:hypothetical protein